MRSIRVLNAAFQRSVGQLRGGVEFLQSVGFVLDQDTMCLVLKSAVNARAELEEGLRLLHNEADDLNIEEAARPQVVVPRAADPTFDVYKSQIHRMQVRVCCVCCVCWASTSDTEYFSRLLLRVRRRNLVDRA